MKYNLKNRPKIEDLGNGVYATDLPKMKKWFEGFEEELHQLQNAKSLDELFKLNKNVVVVWGEPYIKIKEILGE